MPESSPTPERQRGSSARLVLLGLAGVLLVWFVVANSQQVRIHFWVASAQTSLIVVILISAALGAVLGILLSRSKRG